MGLPNESTKCCPKTSLLMTLKLNYWSVIPISRFPKTKVDEDLNAKQMYHRYSGQSEHCKRALSLMDFDKINYNLIESTIEHILESDEYPQEGSILVFLPGLQEIMTLHDQIAKHPLINRHCRLLPLHSSLTSEEQ